MAGLQSGEGPLGLFMGGDLGGVLEKAGVQALESQNLVDLLLVDGVAGDVGGDVVEEVQVALGLKDGQLFGGVVVGVDVPLEVLGGGLSHHQQAHGQDHGEQHLEFVTNLVEQSIYEESTAE